MILCNNMRRASFLLSWRVGHSSSHLFVPFSNVFPSNMIVSYSVNWKNKLKCHAGLSIGLCGKPPFTLVQFNAYILRFCVALYSKPTANVCICTIKGTNNSFRKLKIFALETFPNLPDCRSLSTPVSQLTHLNSSI